MPRRGNVPKREVLPDPVYNSTLVTKLVNSVMLDGKKGVAQRVVYDAFQIVETKTGKNGLDAFQQAMENIMPSLEIKSRRVGGATYQVPLAPSDARPALADCLFPQAQREDHERAPRRRDHGRLQQHRRLCEEARRYPQDGRSEQGILPFPLVNKSKELPNAEKILA